MKVQVNNISYTLVAFVQEEVEVPGIINKTVKKTMVYCYDKTHKPYKFPAEAIERYD